MVNQEDKLSMGANGRRRCGSLSHIAYNELEEAIVTLRLKPGEVLSETALS